MKRFLSVIAGVLFCAAALAAELPDSVYVAVKDGHVQGIFEIDDPNFGNLWTNIPLEDFNNAGFHYGDYVHTKILFHDTVVFEKDVLFHQSFGFAEKGAPMLYNNELMKIAMAVTQGSLAHTYGLSFGADWKVDFTKA